MQEIASSKPLAGRSGDVCRCTATLLVEKDIVAILVSIHMQ